MRRITGESGETYKHADDDGVIVKIEIKAETNSALSAAQPSCR